MPTRAALVAAAILVLAPAAFGSGVTFVTHGFGDGGFGEEDGGWVEDFGAKLVTRNEEDGDVALYLITVGSTGFTWSNVNGVRIDDDEDEDGHAVVMIDWKEFSGDFNLQVLGADTWSVADPLVRWMMNQSEIRKLLALPIHLIGHSRGGSLVGAMAKKLGDYGYWVDQVTFLDPHPWGRLSFADDWGYKKFEVPGNVVFADCYYRKGVYPSGEPTTGSAAVALEDSWFDGSSDRGYENAHSNVHAWYRGTVPEDLNADDEVDLESSAGFSVELDWYDDDAFDDGVARERDETGYAYSLTGGRTRPAAGLHSGLTYDGVWSFVPSESSPIGNVGYVSLGSSSVTAGSSLSAAYHYESWSSSFGVQFYLDLDRNPFNGFDSSQPVGSASLGTSDGMRGKTATLTVSSSQATGTYHVVARTTGSSGVRFFYAPTTLRVTAKQEPDLTVRFTEIDTTVGADQKFTVMVRVSNGGEVAAASPAVTLSLPSGYWFEVGSATVYPAYPIPVGGSTTATWSVRAPDTARTAILSVTARCTVDGHTYWSPSATVSQHVIVYPPSGSVAIDAGAPYASSRSVTLSLSATCADYTEIDDMRFRNEGGSWTGWETYRTSRAWDLPSGDGTKRVWVQYRDEVGTVSAESSDTIDLDTTPPAGTVVLNRGGEYSNTRDVHLLRTASDNLSGVTWMSRSWDGSSWSAWLSYQSENAVVDGDSFFPASEFPGDGTVGVFYRFRDFAGNTSAVYHDSFVLDTTPPAGTVRIDEDAEFTNRTTVALALASSDALSGVEAFRVRDAGGTWSAWLTPAASRTHELPAGDGTKSVDAQYRDRAQNLSPVASDSIVLDQTPPVGSLLVNDDWPATNDRLADLSIYGYDALSGVADLALRESGAGWPAYVAFTTQSSFLLSAGEGTKVVQGVVRDRAGNESVVFEDDILLDQTPPSGSFVVGDQPHYFLPTDPIVLDLDAQDNAGGSGIRDFQVTWDGREPDPGADRYDLSGGSRVVVGTARAIGLSRAAVTLRDWAGNEAGAGERTAYLVEPNLASRPGDLHRIEGAIRSPLHVLAVPIDLVEGDVLSVKVKAKADPTARSFPIGLDLAGPDGTRLIVAPEPLVESKASLKSFPAPESGRYTLVLRTDPADETSRGTMKIKAKVRMRRDRRRSSGVGEDGTFGFDAAQGTLLSGTIEGDGLAAGTEVWAVGPEGQISLPVEIGKGKAKLPPTALDAGSGPYEIVVGSPGSYAYRLSQRPPRATRETPARFRVASVKPGGGAVLDPGDAGPGHAIRVKFSRPPDPQTVLDATNPFNGLASAANFLAMDFTRVAGSADLRKRTLLFRPALDLPAGQYTFTLQFAIVSTSGERLNDGERGTVSSFTVGPDVYPPSIRNTRPGANQQDVPVDTEILVTFDEPLDPATVTPSTVYLEALTPTGESFVPIAVDLTPDGAQARLRPESPLAPTTSFRVTVRGGAAGVTDRAGNAFPGFAPEDRYDYTFVTGEGGSSGGGGSGGGPFLLIDANVSGRDDVFLNEYLELTFSRPVDPDSVRPDSIRIRTGPEGGAAPRGVFLVEGSTVRFAPAVPTRADHSDAGLEPGALYTVTLPGAPYANCVRSATGEWLARDVQLQFATRSGPAGGLYTDNFPDPAPPAIASVAPADHAVEVPTDTRIELVPNRRPFLPESVSTDAVTLTLLEEDGVPVNQPQAISLYLRQSLLEASVTVTPLQPLRDNARYEIRADGLKDLVGNDLAPFVSTFRTRDEP